MSFILVVRDCQRLTFRSSGKEHVRISISVPAEMFLGDESKQDVYRDDQDAHVHLGSGEVRLAAASTAPAADGQADLPQELSAAEPE